MNKYLPETKTENGLSVQIKTESDQSVIENLVNPSQQQTRIFKVNYTFLCFYAVVTSMGMF